MAVDAASTPRELSGDPLDQARDSESEPGEQTTIVTGPADEAGGDSADDAVEDYEAATRTASTLRPALVIGTVIVLALAGLAGWLGFQNYRSYQSQQLRELFLQTGRQGAINLTTIDYTEADADVKRILDSATGSFYDDFSKRSQPFLDVVKQMKSKSDGTVTAAGLESVTDDAAQVLVAVAVKTTNAGAAEQQPRHWRMRIGVKQVGDQVKVSDVAFVP